MAQLECELCERFGHRFALGASSGTATLTIAMSALELGPGDEVLVSGYLWVSCVSSIVGAGAIPRLVDIDDTFTIDPKRLLVFSPTERWGPLCAFLDVPVPETPFPTTNDRKEFFENFVRLSALDTD